MWLWMLWACAQPERYALEGKVLELRPGQVVLEHEPIEGFMDAMVMPFPVEDAQAERLQPGDLIRAELLVDEGMEMELRQIRIVGHLQLELKEDPGLLYGQSLSPLELDTTSGRWTLGRGQEIPTALTFLFTSCPVPEYCPLLSTKLAELQRQLQPGEARILAVTLDPKTDSLEVLRAYGEARGADPELWAFSRLEPAQLSTLLQQAGGTRIEDTDSIQHNLRLLVLDGRGRLQARWEDNLWDPEEVAAALKRPPVEAQ